MRWVNILRVSDEVESKGLDIFKHGEPAYPVVAYGHGWQDDEPKFGERVGELANCRLAPL
jgi:Amt family ammonium transporter